MVEMNLWFRGYKLFLGCRGMKIKIPPVHAKLLYISYCNLSF